MPDGPKWIRWGFVWLSQEGQFHCIHMRNNKKTRFVFDFHIHLLMFTFTAIHKFCLPLPPPFPSHASPFLHITLSLRRYTGRKRLNLLPVCFWDNRIITFSLTFTISQTPAIIRSLTLLLKWSRTLHELINTSQCYDYIKIAERSKDHVRFHSVFLHLSVWYLRWLFINLLRGIRPACT